MKLWVDDLRPPPQGWEWAKTAHAAINIIRACDAKNIEIEVISLDHDLAGHSPEDDGYAVVLFMERWAAFNEWEPPTEMRCHSDNPPGKARIEAGFAAIRSHRKAFADESR